MGGRMKSLFTVIATVLLAALGGAAMVLGEADDSPGLQGIGLLIIRDDLHRQPRVEVFGEAQHQIIFKAAGATPINKIVRQTGA